MGEFGDEMDATDPDPPLARDARDDGDSAQEPHVSGLDSSGSSAAPSLRGWRMGLRLGGAVALLTLLAVAAVALTPLLPRPAPRTPPRPPILNVLSLQIPDNARGCLGAAAWSPDGARVALLRDSQCDPRAITDPNDPDVLIFDTATGKLDTFYSLAGLILAGAPAGAPVAMLGVIWTPRGDQIAVPFTIYPASDESGRASAEGLALLTLRGLQLGALRVTTDSPLPETFTDPLTLSGPHAVAEWGFLPASVDRRRLTVAPAYAYQWNLDGSLAPILLSSPQPDRKDTVSMWRDGQLWLVNARQCTNGLEMFLSQPYLALRLSRLAWSPDGAWLVALSAGARYPPPADTPPPPAPGAPSLSCAQGPAAEDVPLGPEPDKGLRAAESLLVGGVTVSLSLAWRPDGKRLAAFTFNAGAAGSAILVYDCATGTLTRRYTAGQIPNAGQPGTGPAKNFSTIFTGGVWSPDGQRLLVEAAGNGALPFILGPHALG